MPDPSRSRLEVGQGSARPLHRIGRHLRPRGGAGAAASLQNGRGGGPGRGCRGWALVRRPTRSAAPGGWAEKTHRPRSSPRSERSTSRRTPCSGPSLHGIGAGALEVQMAGLHADPANRPYVSIPSPCPVFAQTPGPSSVATASVRTPVMPRAPGAPRHGEKSCSSDDAGGARVPLFPRVPFVLGPPRPRSAASGSPVDPDAGCGRLVRLAERCGHELSVRARARDGWLSR